MRKFSGKEGEAKVSEGNEGGKMSRRDFVAKAAAGLFSLFVGGSVLTSCGKQVPNEGDTNEDEPTTVSDVTLSVLDRAVPDDANGVYAGGQVEVSGTLSDPDGLPTQANLVLDGVGVSYPVTINSDGTFSGTVDSSILPVGTYVLTLSGQDGQGNSFNLDLGKEIRVYPWGEIRDPDSYQDFYWNGYRWDTLPGEYLRIFEQGLEGINNITFGGTAQLIKDEDGNDVSGNNLIVNLDPQRFNIDSGGNPGIEMVKVLDAVYYGHGASPLGRYELKVTVTIDGVTYSFPVLVAGPFE